MHELPVLAATNVSSFSRGFHGLYVNSDITAEKFYGAQQKCRDSINIKIQLNFAICFVLT